MRAWGLGRRGWKWVGAACAGLIATSAGAQEPVAEPAETETPAAAESADEATQVEEVIEAAVEAATQKPAEAPPAPPAPPAPKPSPWSYQLGLNVLALSGNANAVTAKVNAAVDGRWDKWATSIKAGAAYGQSESGTTGEKTTTALNADLLARGDRKFSDHFGGYALAGALTDRVASIEYQGFGEVGVGMTWFEFLEGDFVRSRLRTDVGFRYTHEARHQYFPERKDLPDNNIYSPRVSAGFRYALSKNSVFTQDIEVLPDVVTVDNVRLTATSALSAQIIAGVSLQLGFKVRYIGVPADGAKKTDTELGTGINWAF